jgi:hypothetical protein
MRFAPTDIVMLKENSHKKFEGDNVSKFIAFSVGGDASLIFKYLRKC